jgi:hypothetical protein
MKRILPFVSLLGLILVIGSALWYLFGSMDKESMKVLMLAGTVIWFVSVPLWMDRNEA